MRFFFRRYHLIAGWVLGPVLLFAMFLVACSTTSPTSVERVPKVAGAEFVGNQVCYDCHTNISRVFNTSPHGRIHLVDAAFKGATGCESCHGPGSKHVQSGGGRGVHIVNPGREPAACFECHLDVHAQFNLPQHHPVIEGRMNCVQCHDPHGMDIFKPAGGLRFARQDESCAECHREQNRPVVFEHEALREGCTICHTPHGSITDKMLHQPDNNLCLRCHAQMAAPTAAPGDIAIGSQTRHTQFLSQGTCWSAGCHTAVHGSNVDSKLRY